MHRTVLQKPDGRQLRLYGRQPVRIDGDVVPMPDARTIVPSAHMRWHPIECEWVIYAAHRQDRPLAGDGAASTNPLAPTIDPARPTELPSGNWDVAVFDNRFPSLAAAPGPAPEIDGVTTAPAVGRAEVVVFAQDPGASLGGLGTDRIALVLEVFAERTRALAEAGVQYVLAFENRGTEMGVTLTHPHGQIYAYGFLPARQARAMAALRRHLAETGRDFGSALARREAQSGERLVEAGTTAASFVPAFARFPFELWIVPFRAVPDLASLTETEIADLAAVLGASLRRLDALWRQPMPYLMTINQAPCDGDAHPEWTLRIEIWPIRRSADKLKYLAGTELGAGVFASDVLPEAAAAQLRAVAS